MRRPEKINFKFYENALAYARVSTKGQAEKGLSIPAQLKAIREYANSHGFKIL